MSNNSKNKHMESITSVNFSNYGSLPWPKWSDTGLNSEQWKNSRGNTSHFHDHSKPIALPQSLIPFSWKCPHELTNLQLVIYSSSSSNNHPNLFINNQHLLTSKFMRWFISSVTILSYYGREGLEVLESSGFTWNHRDKPWHGSLYIYSMNKAAPDAQHDPQINPSGRYIVRLFFMGCWRRIEIDDSIPFDSNGKSLLPFTENHQELWPILLAKAMLKVAALSWTSHDEINGFNPIVCLTGWTCMSLNITHLSPNDRWELLTKYSEDRKLPSTSECHSEKLTREKEPSKKHKKHNRKHKDSSQSVEKVKEKNNFPIVTLLCISNMTNDLDQVPDGIIPNYPAYVESTSDITSNPALVKPPLESWKLHRWLPWAMRQGIIDPADYFIPTRRIFLLNPTNVALINEKKKLSSIWLDFNKLSDYPMNVYFFFKYKYFKCSIDIADVLPNELHEDKREKLNSVSRMSTKKLKEKNFDDITQMKKYYEYKHITTQSRNEPLYLFIDSVHSKFLLFDFSTLSEPGRNSSLIIEQHCWFKRSLENNTLLEIKTMAADAKGLCLEAGRHLLRIFCQCKNSYHLKISSDTKFHVGNRRQMYKLMQSESERTKLLANSIINSMRNAFDSFGSLNYRTNLKNYYRSYMPDRKNNVSEIRLYKSIHGYFNKQLTELIMEKCPVGALDALRIFFRDPEMGKYSKPLNYSEFFNSPPNPSMEDINGEYDEKDYYYNRMITTAVTIIQSFWRMIRVNLYKRIHDVNHKRHKSVQQILHQTLLNVVDLNAVCNVLRNFMKCNEELSNLYPCTSDFQNVLNIQDIKGKITSIFPHQWIPIVRLTLNVPTTSIVFACLDLFIDLPAHILQVFNNDTGCEIQRVVNNVIPFHYQRQKKGYTVIGYGWSQSIRIKELKWSLHLTTIKGDPQLIFFNDDIPILSPVHVPPLELYELSNIYIPNVHNLILKAILKMPGGCWTSLRVHTTYKKVQMMLRVKSNNEKIVAEVFGGSTIILPIIYLESEEDEWIIEAIVSLNSWPLTAEEWDIVMKAKKTMGQEVITKKQLVASIGKTSRSRQASTHLPEAPRWFLQVVCDSGTHLELYQDTSRHMEFQQIKQSWKLHDPNRITRGNEIRKNFLRDNCLDEIAHEQKKFIDNEIRSLKCPQERTIPSWKLSKFFVAKDNENRRLKTKSDDELERIERERLIMEFEEAHTSYIERLNSLLCDLQLNVGLSAKIPTKRNI